MKKKRLLIAIITVLFVVATVIFYNYILKDETEVAIEAYCTFLAGEAYITDEKWGVETRITIAPTEQGKYTLIDMNDDGIPELVTNVITQQLHDICRNASYSSSVAGIYTYQNGEITEWYTSYDKSFALLRNRALLYEYEADNKRSYHYYYFELDCHGEISYYMHGVKRRQIEHGKWSDKWEYYLSDVRAREDLSIEDALITSNRDLSIEVATEKEWLDLLEPYLSLRTDTIPWNDYTIETHGGAAMLVEERELNNDIMNYCLLAKKYGIYQENICETPLPVNENPILSKLLKDTLAKDVELEKEGLTREVPQHDYFVFDFNGDGLDDYLVCFHGFVHTGSAGNIIDIYIQTDDGRTYQSVLHINSRINGYYELPGEHAPIAALNKRIDGFYSIALPWTPNRIWSYSAETGRYEYDEEENVLFLEQ